MLWVDAKSVAFIIAYVGNVGYRKTLDPPLGAEAVHREGRGHDISVTVFHLGRMVS